MVMIALSLLPEAHANELYNQSQIVPIRISPVISDKKSSKPIFIKVCTAVDGNEKCDTYPKLSSIDTAIPHFSWDYFLNRCNSFALNNRFVFGAKVLHSALILGLGLVTGAAALPQTGKSLLKFMATTSGLSGASSVSMLTMANWSLTPGAPYPDYEIPSFPSDQVGLQEELYFSGMSRAQQMIDFILNDQGRAKTLSDLDILAFQEILSKCNDPRLKKDLINDHQKECLHSCHQ